MLFILLFLLAIAIALAASATLAAAGAAGIAFAIAALIAAIAATHLALATWIWTRRPPTRTLLSRRTWGLLTLPLGLPAALAFAILHYRPRARRRCYRCGHDLSRVPLVSPLVITETISAAIAPAPPHFTAAPPSRAGAIRATVCPECGTLAG